VNEENEGKKKKDIGISTKEKKKKRKENENDEKEETEAEEPSLVKCTLRGLCITCRLQSFTLLFRLLVRASVLVPTSSSLSLGDIVFNMIRVVCLGNIEPYLRKPL